MVFQKANSKGFSIIEVLVVVAIGLVLTAIAVVGFRGVRTNIKTVKAANVATSLIQQARQSAITNRRPHSVTISRVPDSSGNRNVLTINSIDITQTPPVTNVVRIEYLPQDVAIALPTNVPLTIAANMPPQDTFQLTDFMGMDTVTIFFNIDGSVTSGSYFPQPASNPFRGSFFFADAPNAGATTQRPELVRVVSLYGSTGGVKTWYYDGTTFRTGSKNF